MFKPTFSVLNFVFSVLNFVFSVWNFVFSGLKILYNLTFSLSPNLLKDKGMTINGVKNILKSNINTLDDYNSFSLKADYYKENIKKKSSRILHLLKNLKKHGKKNTH